MKTAIIYSFNTTRTSAAAKKIADHLQQLNPELLNADEMNPDMLLSFDFIIAGVPTWFDGELPFYWDEWLPALEDVSFNNKKLAVFGLADQKNYPDNFADAIGIFADYLLSRGCMLMGKTSTEGYVFRNSRALADGLFKGLVLDEDQQPQLSDQRIEQWTDQLIREIKG